MSQELTGYGVGQGTAVAPVLHMSPALPIPADRPRVESVENAIASAQRASAMVSKWLNDQADKLSGTARDILQATALMAQDPSLLSDVASRIKAGKTSERAVYEAIVAFRDQLSTMGGYFAERANDLDDVSQRIRAELNGVLAPGVPTSKTPFILIAKDLSPADTAGLDFDMVLALVTEEGGPTSHTAVLARANNLPAVVGVPGATAIGVGKRIVVDAADSRIVVDPSDELVESILERSAAHFRALKHSQGPGHLSDGTSVQLLANLGSVSDVESARIAGCEGVGLFRTEFLFLDSPVAPSLKEQRAVYQQLLDSFPGQKVVVRLLDAGADKPLPYLTSDDEDNPALGVRGYRALRAESQILETQLRALQEAQDDNLAKSNSPAELWVMAPMIADAVEAAEFTNLAKSMGIKCAGVMAEVPSIAVVADQVAVVTDFFSVGTNDLTQYALAADRQLGAMAGYQDPWHPAVLRFIRSLGRAATDAEIPLSVCGEAAADPDLAAVLVGLGASSLSMAPAAVANVRLRLAEVNLAQAQEAARIACAAFSPQLAKQNALTVLTPAD